MQGYRKRLGFSKNQRSKLIYSYKICSFPNSKKRPKSLVDSFYYLRLGAGMLWEKFEKLIQNEYDEFSTI